MYKLFQKNILFLLLFSLCFGPVLVHAEVCDPKTVEIILRDSSGDYIPNMNYELYVQETDVDGRPKPTTLIRAGKIDANLGKASVTFSNEETKYAIRAYDQKKDGGSFWFYNDVNVACGETVEVTEYISNIKVILRNTEGELIRNKEFKIYSQRYDADNDPIKEVQDLVGTLNTSTEGEDSLYVPESQESIDGNGPDYYVMEVIGSDMGVYKAYDIHVSGSDETTFTYTLSDLKLTLKDENGILFPANEKISIYEQTTDVDGEKVLGTFIKDILTSDKGEAVLQYPEGTYVARVKGADGRTVDFWDLDINAKARAKYELMTSEDWTPVVGACSEESVLDVSTKTVNGEVIGGLFFTLYEQTVDANGSPAPGKLIHTAKMDTTGKIAKAFKPDPRKKYAMKLHQGNATVGAIWEYNTIQFRCGEDLSLVKNIPAINIVLRDGNGELVKDKVFSLYTQKIDVDGFSVREKKDLVAANYTTSGEGKAVIYVNADEEIEKIKKQMYVMEVKGEKNKIYNEYDIALEPSKDTYLDYTFSDIVLEVLNGIKQAIKNTSISIYLRDTDASGNYSLGKLELTEKTNDEGKVRFALANGFYSVKILDSGRKNTEIHNVRISNRMRKYKTILFNTTRLSVRSSSNVYVNSAAISIYELNKNEDGDYTRGNIYGTINTGVKGIEDFTFSPNPYLFVYRVGADEYGRALYVENGKLQELYILVSGVNKVQANDIFYLVEPPRAMTLADKMKGRILLQVEGNGEAWYVDGNTKKRYYMKDGATAYGMMRDFGLGISNVNLDKIPVGLDERFAEFDYDGDFISDKMEEALGTDMYDHDSDDDSYSDGEEIMNGFNPRGEGSLNLDQKFADSLRGKILLQVESRGEAWYIHPENGKRYYMKDGDSAYEIMRFLSLGITNENLDEIEVGRFN